MSSASSSKQKTNSETAAEGEGEEGGSCQRYLNPWLGRSWKSSVKLSDLRHLAERGMNGYRINRDLREGSLSESKRATEDLIDQGQVERF